MHKVIYIDTMCANIDYLNEVLCSDVDTEDAKCKWHVKSINPIGGESEGAFVVVTDEDDYYNYNASC